MIVDCKLIWKGNLTVSPANFIQVVDIQYNDEIQVASIGRHTTFANRKLAVGNLGAWL
jgi:hypothetical protein